MSIGPFNLVANGTDNLVFSATDNWVVDQEVTPGGSATWKVTPAFDTTLFDIPGDIAIWYSVGGGAFAESTELDHSLTVEITSNTTVIAKMAYSGTGADITSSTGTNLTTTTQQSVNLTVGPITTIGTVTVTGSAAPTEGVAESYTVAFDGNATDATYLWTTTDGSATIATPTAATTDITFSTSGSFTVTCTVSSATASDSPASDDLAVTVAAAGPSYDVLQVTGPGGNGTVGPYTVENGTRFTFASGDFEYDTWGIVAFGYQAVGLGYVVFQFKDTASRDVFYNGTTGTYPPGTGFTFLTDAGFNTSTGFVSYTHSADNVTLRYNNANTSLASWGAALATSATCTINNP
jgi:hypothetical protein